ncbi:MAG: rhodanese-like domain-containing protein [Gammaproteobacteria bacterium]|nr:rhodanese-like domain-containing protein [Gammaproteobacteria bacterium]
MKRQFLLLSLFLLPLISFAANWPPEVDQMVKATKQSVKLIDIKAFKRVVDNPGDALIIDVREPHEYYNGYIKGAINIPRGLIEFRIWKQLGFPEKINKDQQIYLYCRLSGRSALAAKSLTSLGLKNVTAVDMTTADWEAAGYTFEF